MRRLVFSALAGLAAASASGIAASQAWVESYVSNYVARSAGEVSANTKTEASGGVTEITTGDGAVLTMEDATDAALKVRSATAASVAAGVTNGTLFAWNGAGAYMNPHGTITATPTNLVFSGVSSVSTNGVERFAGWFDALPVRIQPSVSLSVTNGTEEASR